MVAIAQYQYPIPFDVHRKHRSSTLSSALSIIYARTSLGWLPVGQAIIAYHGSSTNHSCLTRSSFHGYDQVLYTKWSILCSTKMFWPQKDNLSLQIQHNAVIVGRLSAD